ncbi:MAG TPA: hypothetical protein VLG12_03440 [Candidatus Saccharimonadales bacterium]|nr:hypothetical protein [Candidatus Saccharimonadales bacterium]
MKAIAILLENIGIKKTAQKTLAQYKEEVLFKEGREQFKALLQRGLQVPVSIL